MEKRVNKKLENYVTSFKDESTNKIKAIDFNEKTKVNEVLEFIYEYQRFSLNKDDLSKRKRIKNAIPVTNRCIAKRANDEQCTRRRKEGCEFCGTHSKGIPNGQMVNMNIPTNTQKLEVFAQEICGIVYYIDKYDNVYKTEDIMAGKENPVIIAKCIKEEKGYTIPELGLV
jgi:hypothetical protein